MMNYAVLRNVSQDCPSISYVEASLNERFMRMDIKPEKLVHICMQSEADTKTQVYNYDYEGRGMSYGTGIETKECPDAQG